MSVNTPEVGDRRKIVSPVKKLCCVGTLRLGEVCEVQRILSENRLLIQSVHSGHSGNYHKVKRSTFMTNTVQV